jgi:hypothetical protein
LENSQLHHHHTSTELAKLQAIKPAMVDIDKFDPYDRERLLELLLSQVRGLTLLILNMSDSLTLFTHAGESGQHFVRKTSHWNRK